MIKRNVPLRRKVPVKKISDKQRTRNQEWRVTREKARDPHDTECKMKVACNGSPAETWQHTEGRDGDRLNNIELLVQCCLRCHLWCDEHPREAIEKGFAKPRLYGR